MKSNQFKKTIMATAVAIILVPVSSGAKPNRVKHFGKNAPFSIEDLPTGKMKSKLKAMRPDKKKKAMKWLHSFDFTRHDLKHMKLDDEGGVLYSDSFDMTELTDTVAGLTEQPQPVSVADTFKLHSKPGAGNVIYIDVDGHTISGTAWNSSTSSIQARPFDTDGNSAAFSTTELAQIAEIWHRIAEDYAPFDVDVTTEEPVSFGPTTGRILITYNKDVSGNDMPYASAGGVAYVNVWGRSNYASYYSPALVYYNNLASFPPYISEAASHEMGHNLGLSHDGTSTQSYYAGQGSGFVSWGPIMGVGYYTNVTQWSKGEYPDASQTQDDISIIGSYLSFRTDDHGNSIYTPTSLLVDAQGNIAVTSPETDPYNLSPENKGIIETRNDVDFFAFDAGAGALDITVTPAWDSFYRSSRRGANLDIQASLYDWDGNLIARNDPIDETDAQITTTVIAGQYLLAISGVGNSVTPYSDYGSLGEYFISGKVEPFSAVTDTTPPSPDPMGWAVAPYSQSRTSISMQATMATDDSGTVQYNFICVSGPGCNDSGWQDSNQFTATGLQAGSSYSFQVIAQDAYANQTSPSSIAEAATQANTTPQTQNSSISTQEDTSVTIDLAAQSSDADADPLTFVIQSQPANGSVVNYNNGTVSYTPASNYNGTDSFNYTVNDGFGGSANGTVSITVTAVNDAPVASASAPNTNSTLSVSFSSVGSFDPDIGDTLSYNWNFGDGNSSNAANPTYSYAAAGSYNVTLTVSDNQGLSDAVTISTTVVDSTNALPDTPSNLTYTMDKIVTGRGRRKIVSGTVTLTWNPANFAEQYNIWRCDVITKGHGRRKTTSCSYSLYTSTVNTSYVAPLTNSKVRYKINAKNAKGTSGFSNEVTVSP